MPSHPTTLALAAFDPCGAEQQLRRLQADLRLLHSRIGEQFAAAVTDDRLDVDVANGMLDTFGMPPLPLRWRVHLSLPMVCEVTAGTAEDAFNAAAEAVENTVRATVRQAPGFDITFDTREDQRATPGEVDTEAVATYWAGHHRST